MSTNWSDFLSARARNMRESAIREILKITQRPDIISFAGGLPASELFPIERFIDAARTVLTENGEVALQYTVTEGYPTLRNFIAAYVKKHRVDVEPESVLITGGSQQGIDLVGKIFIDPGDVVAIESPSYLGAIQALNAYGPRFVVVPMDDSGMRVDRLQGIVSQHRVKAVYIVPNYQNPSGISLAAQRRERLIRLAKEHSFILIEDDPYSDLYYESKSGLPLMALGQTTDPSPMTIYLGTFSKILAPGIRLGWVVAPEEVITKLAQAKQASDLHESTLLQMITFEVVRNGFLEKHIKIIRRTYRDRRDAMLEAIETSFPTEVQWTRPGGGLFIWVTLPKGYDAAQLLPKAVDEGVAFVPGTDFHADSSGGNTMRLNFSNATPENIHTGIRRLGELLKRELRM